ncbi:MAG: ABC transporter ATP-binding protein [Rikenellaceae bacterium]|nr:ABC transporter ATP-binding protein [Rikenellaceae bacterium]
MSHHFLLFDNIHYSYTPEREVLRGLTLRLDHGEKVALVGANGAGKSTLMLHANGLLTPSQGRIVVGDMELTAKTLRTIRQSVGLVFQNPDDQLFMPTVEEDVGFGPANMHLSREEITERIERALRAVGALDLRHRSPQQLSGGEKRRVAIATVLAMEPSILIMDEPSAGLDPRARRQMIELLLGFGHTALIATHDLDMAQRLCSRTVIMLAGQVAADGPTSQILGDSALLDRCGL